jgi:hypothetical protein
MMSLSAGWTAPSRVVLAGLRQCKLFPALQTLKWFLARMQLDVLRQIIPTFETFPAVLTPEVSMTMNLGLCVGRDTPLRPTVMYFFVTNQVSFRFELTPTVAALDAIGYVTLAVCAG